MSPLLQIKALLGNVPTAYVIDRGKIALEGKWRTPLRDGRVSRKLAIGHAPRHSRKRSVGADRRLHGPGGSMALQLAVDAIIDDDRQRRHQHDARRSTWSHHLLPI
jgi:hypothetical protein